MRTGRWKCGSNSIGAAFLPIRSSVTDARDPDTLRATDSVRISEVLAALSFALDLTEGQPMGHALRTNLVAQWLADRFGLSMRQRTDLYYASLLKDVGCSSNAARVFELFGGDDRSMKSARMLVDWASYAKAVKFGLVHAAPGASWLERAKRIATLARAGPAVASELVATRCTQGGSIVRSLGLHKLNQVVERPDTPSMRGAVAKVPHLLRIVE